MASLAMRVQQESGVVDRHKSNEVRGGMFMHVSAVLHVESDVGQQQHTARVELACSCGRTIATGHVATRMHQEARCDGRD